MSNGKILFFCLEWLLIYNFNNQIRNNLKLLEETVQKYKTFLGD